METTSVNPYEAPQTEQVPPSLPAMRGDSFREMKIFAWLAAICIGISLPFALLIFLLILGVFEAPMDVLEMIDVVHGIIFVLGVIFYCIWKYRCACNARFFYGGTMDNTPGWCVGSYFIPILMLFRPYQCMKEIFAKTYLLLEKKSPGGLILTWWLVWILSNFFDRFAMKSEDPGVIATMHGLTSACAVLVIWVIFILTRRQYEIMENDSLAAKIGTLHPIYQSLPSGIPGMPMKRPQLEDATKNEVKSSEGTSL